MSSFQFKQFVVHQSRSALKVGTDAMVLGSLIESQGKRNALDIGAGTGVLSLMIAQRNEQLSIDAVEIDEPSIEDCRQNFELSPWEERLFAIHVDFLALEFKQKYDLIISNPPFYTDSLNNESERIARAKHASYLPIESLFKRVVELLEVWGEFWLIVPDKVGSSVISIAAHHGLFPVKQVSIFGKPESPTRIVFAFSTKKKQCQHATLLIRNENGDYTADYIDLTKDFHFKDLSKIS